MRPAATLLSSIALLSVSALSAAQTLIQAQIGEQHSQTVYAMSLGSYELENGEIQSMREFYSTPWRDVRLVALSQVLPNVGVIWGASLGRMTVSTTHTAAPTNSKPTGG